MDRLMRAAVPAMALLIGACSGGHGAAGDLAVSNRVAHSTQPPSQRNRSWCCRSRSTTPQKQPPVSSSLWSSESTTRWGSVPKRMWVTPDRDYASIQAALPACTAITDRALHGICQLTGRQLQIADPTSPLYAAGANPLYGGLSLRAMARLSGPSTWMSQTTQPVRRARMARSILQGTRSTRQPWRCRVVGSPICCATRPPWARRWWRDSRRRA